MARELVIQRFCRVCQQQRPHTKQGIAHLLHFCLSFATCGMWLLVWVLLGVVNVARGCRCTFCGSAKH